MTRPLASVLALLLSSGGSARASAAGAEPASPPSHEQPEPRPVKLVGFAAELGGSPGVFVAKLGFGAARGPEAPDRLMAWLEADGTDWFRPRHPANAGRVDQILWIYPHVELTRQLLRRYSFSGWIRAGPTIGRYNAGGVRIWFPGAAAGAGFLWSPIRVGVTYYGQWKTTTVSPAGPFASPDVRMEPMVLVTAGLEFVKPLPP
ncbi:MAG TPA: hypothetical protein VIV57_05940 [Anaeromyxobacter sp.]